MLRIATLLVGMIVLAACTPATPDEPLEQLGEFSLGHNVVVASKMQKGPVSRDASEEEWVTSLRSAIDERFSRYQGSQLYHMGVSVEGYMLAPPGVPVIYSPKSALIINVTVWDDALAKKLNPEVKQFTVFETTTADSAIVGSGHTRSKEEQMMGLSRNAVGQIEDWLLEMHREKGWFNKRPGTSPAAAAANPVQG